MIRSSVRPRARPQPIAAKRRPIVAIITPYLAASNAGNWHTAARWARFLRGSYRVLLLDAWRGERADVLVALHARRSAGSIAAWAAQAPDRPLIVVLTGTDLYRDIASDAAAQRSLDLASRLVVLNEVGPRALPRRVRGKAVVVLQSAPALAPWRPSRGRAAADAKARSGRAPAPAANGARPHFDVAVVGHLRIEKDPMTVLQAAQNIRPASSIRIRHVGRGLDRSLEQWARTMTRVNPHYEWLGERSRAQARQVIRRARVLLHASRMEGGAQAVIEAITAGTPVIASRIDGNVGLLGAGYPGYFPVGNACRAAQLLQRAERDPAFLRSLQDACKKRAPLFDPRRERAALLGIVANELADNPRRPTTSRRTRR